MKTRKLITLCAPFIIGGIVALGLTPPVPSVDYGSTTAPDWTYLPCTAWTDGQTPVIPPYTRTDACVLPDLTLTPNNN